ncbi:hypothetical protein LWI29_021620 [Acer saccharum]|uniref:RNase H type-1 domain-containing protein n=1 Tax=Acer saccharum TaxID=4024 RepID=A0AA39SFH7_ACESA|nr:hypothetical protein LWI29_021620 [Acer saccharum]
MWLGLVENEESVLRFMVTAWLLWRIKWWSGQRTRTGVGLVNSLQITKIGGKVVGLHRGQVSYDNVRIVIRDNSGIIVRATALSIKGMVTVEFAEAKAILEGLTVAVELGCFPLCVESDALRVVDLCKETSFSCADVDNIVFDIFS